MNPNDPIRKIKPAPNPLLSSSRGYKVELDFKAYFLEFCKIHGEPVEYKGRLLFSDGWMYSLTDYQGPEYHPPLDNRELDIFILNYWLLRRSYLTNLLLKYEHELKLLKDVQASHSLPLQQVVKIQDEQRIRKHYKPLTLNNLEQRVEWVRKDLIECDVRLKEIEDYHCKVI